MSMVMDKHSEKGTAFLIDLYGILRRYVMKKRGVMKKKLILALHRKDFVFVIFSIFIFFISEKVLYAAKYRHIHLKILTLPRFLSACVNVNYEYIDFNESSFIFKNLDYH